MENDFVNQFKEEITDYSKSTIEAGKLRLVRIISRVLGLFLLLAAIMLCVIALICFGAVAAINAMSACMPVWAAALISAGVFMVLIAIAIICRKPLFVHPFIRLMTKDIKTEQELELQAMQAKHNAELQRVRMSTQAENVARDVDIFVGILRSLWNSISEKKSDPCR